jgi:hypothetical protein
MLTWICCGVTAITPTPLGEGKTVTAVGLSESMNAIGIDTMLALREPSLGPVFGIKGGAAGGGYSQVVPMEDLNLHFTGDIHAVGTANNLLAAMIDSHLMHGNELDIDPLTISWRRCVDLNDRAMREIVNGLGGRLNGIPRQTGYDITVASEVMAILGLATSLKDLRERLGRITFGYSKDGKNSNLSTTHYALQGLKDAGVPEDSDVWKRAVAFVSACQNNAETNKAEWAGVDNGFIYSPKPESKAGEIEVRGKKGWRSYASMTYAGYLSYVYARLGNDDPRVKAALKWISENYSLDENPGVKDQGLYYYYLTFATAMVARGEGSLKDKDGKEHLWAPELAGKLISLQSEDGSWLNKSDRWEEGDKVICTAYAVRALGKALKFMKAEAAAPAKDPTASAVDRAL